MICYIKIRTTGSYQPNLSLSLRGWEGKRRRGKEGFIYLPPHPSFFGLSADDAQINRSIDRSPQPLSVYQNAVCLAPPLSVITMHVPMASRQDYMFFRHTKQGEDLYRTADKIIADGLIIMPKKNVTGLAA